MAPALRSIDDLPMPRALPLIGNAHLFARDPLRAHLVTEELARELGPIYRVRIGRKHTMVMISDRDEIDRILKERPATFRRGAGNRRSSRSSSRTATACSWSKARSGGRSAGW